MAGKGGFSRKGAAFSRHPKPPPSGGWSIHSTLASTAALSVAGLFTGVLYLHTGSLALPIGAHIAWNFCEGRVFDFPLSGRPQAQFSAVTTIYSGPGLWTGGPFGPEAGLLSLAAIVLAAGIAIVLTKPSPLKACERSAPASSPKAW